LPSAERAEKAELKSTYRTRDQIIDELRKEYRKLYGKSGESNEGEMIWVIDPKGQKGKIPKRNLERALKLGYKEYEG
jgi:hypothetical protein